MIAISVKLEPLKPADAMQGFELDNYAASWARRLGLPRGAFERDAGEADAAYRPRLLKMLRDTVEAP